ncbi:hypothetical protein J2X42_001902 [Arthrobacter sp. BE255]|nr:hypothetical protein [Arthrobacter sp. BE255]
MEPKSSNFTWAAACVQSVHIGGLAYRRVSGAPFQHLRYGLTSQLAEPKLLNYELGMLSLTVHEASETF